jgi:hypothetical protein
VENELNKAKSQGMNDNVQKALKNVQFPASKQDLVRVAQQNNVPDPIVDKYNGPQDVMKAVQQLA